MEVIHTLSSALYFATAVLCFVTGGILLFYSYRERKTNVFLGLSFIMMASVHFVLYLIQSTLILEMPHLYRTGNIFALLYMPLSYLYIRISVTGKKIHGWDFIHLIPVLIYVIDLLPFFMLSASDKIAILTKELYQINVLTRFSQGWLLPDNFHTPARIVLIAIYWIAQVRLVVKQFFPIEKLDRPVQLWVKWILVYFGLQLLLYLPALVILPRNGHPDFFWLLNVPSSLGALSMAISVLLYPKLVYGLEIEPEEIAPVLAKPRAPLDDEFVTQTGMKLEQYLQDQRPFLKQGYSIKDLAEELGMPLHHLSAFINQSLGKNFNDLMNFYRILYCQELFQSGEAKSLNLHGLALKCGFSNRNTFTIAFKKCTGLTPSDYLKLVDNYNGKLKTTVTPRLRNGKRTPD